VKLMVEVRVKEFGRFWALSQLLSLWAKNTPQTAALHPSGAPNPQIKTRCTRFPPVEPNQGFPSERRLTQMNAKSLTCAPYESATLRSVAMTKFS